MKKIKQILAWIGIILLVSMYLIAVIFSLIKSEFAQTMFRAALGCTIIIPVFLYLIMMIAKSMRPKKSDVVDAVIFDMGNVLLDYPWNERPDDYDFSPEFRKCLKEYVNPHPLWRELDCNLRPYDGILNDFVSGYPQFADEIRSYITSMPDIITPFWYTKDLLRALKRKSYKVYYLSNWCKAHHDVMTENGSFDFVRSMDGGIWSFEVGCAKPDRKIFDSLKNKYHLTPERCVFIDDNEDNVKAARKYGYAAIHFTDYTDMIEKLAAIGVTI